MDSRIENRENSRLLTLTAFLIGYALVDDLSSTEQNALGGFFMAKRKHAADWILIGQTLSTNSGFHFNNDWNRRVPSSNNNYSKEDTIRLLRKANEELVRQINNLSK